VLKHTNTYRLT